MLQWILLWLLGHPRSRRYRYYMFSMYKRF